MEHEPIQKMVQRIYNRLGVSFPFFMQTAVNFEIIETTQEEFAELLHAQGCGQMADAMMANRTFTLATNGECVRFSVEGMAKFTKDEQLFAFVHEIMHIVLHHAFRRGTRDPQLWNIACDFVINGDLKDNEGMMLPQNVLYDERFKGMSEEQVYALLQQEQQSKPQTGNGNGAGSGYQYNPDLLDNKGTPEQQREARDKVNGAVMRAAHASQQFGKGSPLIQRLLGDIMHPKETWQEQLRRYFTKLRFDDYSWNRLNRRELRTKRIISPIMMSENLNLLDIGFDLSGSISDELAQDFTNELNGIIDECRPERVRVWYFDDGVRKVMEYTSADYPIKAMVEAGGGTDFRPVFTAIERSGDVPDVLVMLTDTWGAFPSEAPEFPTVWASCDPNGTAPFGEVVFIS